MDMFYAAVEMRDNPALKGGSHQCMFKRAWNSTVTTAWSEQIQRRLTTPLKYRPIGSYRAAACWTIRRNHLFQCLTLLWHLLASNIPPFPPLGVSTTNSNSILGLGTVYLISHHLAAFILYSHSLHPLHSGSLNRGLLELVPISLSFRFRPWSRYTTDTLFKLVWLESS